MARAQRRWISIESTSPGAEIVEQAMSDLERDVRSPAALGLQVVAPRLRAAGFAVPLPELDDAPELCLYRRLTEEQVLDPYGTYNALLRRLYSFAAAIEAELYRGKPGG